MVKNVFSLFQHVVASILFLFILNSDFLIFVKVTPPSGFDLAASGFETTEHLRNRMRKENCRTRL